ncbi:MAG: FecCD family ABC transporter permease [Candidatus Cryptobacteroides sp.]
MKTRTGVILIVLSALTVLLFIADLAVGSVSLPAHDVWKALFGGDVPDVTVKIVREIRLMKALTAVIAGVSLSVGGLLMQTLFRNPLAGPYVLGISSGASLGVALFILGMPLLGISGNSVLSSIGVAGSAWIGAALVLALVAAASIRIKDIMVILILGMMLSSGVSSIVQILQYLSDEQSLKSFVLWTMGSLGDVTSAQMKVMVPTVICGLGLAVASVKSLNLMLLGENYAKTMGMDVNRSRMIVFLATTLLAGTVTAFCGPVGFIGLAVPHIARAMFRSADHRILLPGSALSGAVILLFCDIFSKWLSLPINTITALLGIPIVVWVVVRNKSIV